MIFKKLSIAVVLFSTALMAQQQGTNITYTLTTDKSASGTMNMYYQNGSSRMEMEFSIPAAAAMGPVKMVSITQADKPNTTFMLNEAGKTYTENERKTTDAEKKTDDKDYVVTVLGREKVGNYNATHVKIQHDKTEYEMWLTKDIVAGAEYYKNDNKYTGNEKLYKALEAKQAGGFPVKIVHNETGSREGTVTLTLTKFEKAFVSADKFQIPAGYTKTATTNGIMPVGMPGQKEIMNMTPEEREKLIEQMKKQYGGKEGN